MSRYTRALARIFALLLLGGLCLQLYFLMHVGWMNWADPSSTTFQRSEIYRIVTTQGQLPWRQTWQDATAISNHLKRAVITSEDANFVDHPGVEVAALKKAWQRNSRAQDLAAEQRQRQLERHERAVARALKRGRTPPSAPDFTATPTKVVGGSTITQQLAKNLFLSKERNFLRKAQELVVTFMLETALSKERILTIYLNNVEWGEGVFGAEAAAQHYFRVPAAKLSAMQAARLAVKLPAPKRFEKQPTSAYVLRRAATIAARMRSAELP